LLLVPELFGVIEDAHAQRLIHDGEGDALLSLDAVESSMLQEGWQ
jgi:hypothetical protein